MEGLKHCLQGRESRFITMDGIDLDCGKCGSSCFCFFYFF